MSIDADISHRESNKAATARRSLQGEWWNRLIARPDAALHHHIRPGKFLMLGADSDEQKCAIAPGIRLDYLVWPNSCEVSLSICDHSRRNEQDADTQSPTVWEIEAYQSLRAHKCEIENAFGEALDWSEGGLVCSDIDGGYDNAECEWGPVIERQVQAMNRLHAAILPHLDALPGPKSL